MENTYKVSLATQLLALEDIDNARQLGGYPAADGRRIKDGLLFRSASLDSISEDTARKLAEVYNVKQVVDLRMAYERAASPDKDIPDAENTWINVCEMDMNAPENKELMKKIEEVGDNEMKKVLVHARSGKLGDLYPDILLGEAGRAGYCRFFDILLAAEGAVLWHCTYGKDRTGLAAALIMYALGVDEDIILQDFLLTNVVYKHRIEMMRELASEMESDDRVLDDVAAVAGVRQEYFEIGFDRIKARYGTVQNYLTDFLGITNEQIGLLKNKYLV